MLNFFKRFGAKQQGPLKGKLLTQAAQDNIKSMCMQGAAMRDRTVQLYNHLFKGGIEDASDKDRPYGAMLNEYFNLVGEFDILMGVIDAYAHEEAKKALAKYTATEPEYTIEPNKATWEVHVTGNGSIPLPGDQLDAPPVPNQVPEVLKFGQGKKKPHRLHR